MYCQSISYLVGSANEKLANDMKKIEKQKAIRASIELEKKLQEYNKQKENKFCCFKDITQDSYFYKLNLILTTSWIFRVLLFIIFGSLFGFSIYRVVQYRRICCGFIDTNYQYLNDKILQDDWQSTQTPLVYEIEPLTFHDSNGDGYGDLNGIKMKLDYFKYILQVNCILIKHMQSSFSFKYFDLQLIHMDLIDDKIGTVDDLKSLINEAHKKSIKVILELEIASTSIDHGWFNDEKEIKMYYSTKTTINKFINVNETNKWTYNKNFNLYYYNNGIENRAYLNYDNIQVRDQLSSTIKSWFNSELADGIYIKDLHDIFCTNQSVFESFVFNIKNLSISSSVKLIVNYEALNYFKNKENANFADFYRVQLEPTVALSELMLNRNPFNKYLNVPEHQLLWSFKPFKMSAYQYEQRRYMMIALYTLLYSLPGNVVIRQGDELEYTNFENLPQIFRWNDLDHHSGFSTVAQSLWWFPSRVNRVPVIEDGFDLKIVNTNKKSLFNALKLFNQRVKGVLINDKNTYNLRVDKGLYVISRSVFKPSYKIRETNNHFIIFMLNFSPNEYSLREIIETHFKNQTSFNNSKPIRFLTIYDSTYNFNLINLITLKEGSYYNNKQLESFSIKSNQYLVLELEI